MVYTDEEESDGVMDGGKKEEDKRAGLVPTRYLVALVGAMGLLPVVGTRKTLALVLTHVTAVDHAVPEELIFTNCTVYNTSRDNHLDIRGDTMFLLHAVFYLGGTLMYVAGSVLSTRFNPIWMITGSVLGSGVITVSLPVVLTASVPLLFCLRLLQGALEAIQQPGTTGVLSAWSTDRDKALLFSIYYTGAYLAPALAAVVTSATMCFVSWDSAFYICGCMSVLWSVTWFITMYSTPHAHPSLSRRERDFHQQHGPQVQQSSKAVQLRIPWRDLLTSPPVWSVFVGFFCHTFVYSMLVVEQGQYLFDSYNIDTSSVRTRILVTLIGILLPVNLYVFRKRTSIVKTELCRQAMRNAGLER